MSTDNRQPAFPFRMKESHRSYRFNEGSDTWDFNVASRKFSECLPTVSNIECEYERIEAYVHSAIAERRDLSTLVRWALSAEYYSEYGGRGGTLRSYSGLPLLCSGDLRKQRARRSRYYRP